MGFLILSSPEMLNVSYFAIRVFLDLCIWQLKDPVGPNEKTTALCPGSGFLHVPWPDIAICL